MLQTVLLQYDHRRVNLAYYLGLISGIFYLAPTPMPASKEDEEYLEFLSGTDTDVEITSGGCKQHLAGGDAGEAALLHLHRDAVPAHLTLSPLGSLRNVDAPRVRSASASGSRWRHA